MAFAALRQQENTPDVVFYTVATISVILWIVYELHQRTRQVRLGKKIPGPKPLPFLGNSLMFIGKSPNEVMDILLYNGKLYGSVIKCELGWKQGIFLTDAEDISAILDSHVHIDKADEYSFFKPWLGEGLLISSGEKWRTHRKMIAPTFHAHILKSFMSTFNQRSQITVGNMRKEIGKTFDVHDYMSEVTVDILLETAMGITKSSQEKSGFDYAMAVMKMCDIVHKRHYNFWLHPDTIFNLTSYYKKQVSLLNIIHGLTDKVLKEKKNLYVKKKTENVSNSTSERQSEDNRSSAKDSESFGNTLFKGLNDDLDFIDENDVGEKKRLAFLDLMIESKENGTNKISDEEIMEEVNTIMFEGHDTTAAGTSFALCLLGVHQDIQNKVYDELFEIFGDSDRPCTFNDTIEMKYLERVILETLRMYPPVPGIARKLKHDVKISTNNYVLPAGSTILIGTYALHRKAKYYKNPNVFNPDNFLPENTQNRHYYSFIPFSAGPRSCVGRKYALLKLKVLISTILRNYKVHSDIPEDQFQLQCDIILKRSDGFKLKIEPRERKASNVSDLGSYIDATPVIDTSRSR